MNHSINIGWDEMLHLTVASELKALEELVLKYSISSGGILPT